MCENLTTVIAKERGCLKFKGTTFNYFQRPKDKFLSKNCDCGKKN